nr:sugar ABC transporter ATP-binding protein [Alicyclobacillus mali (ex Roth et al. 2021)]
MAKEGRHVNKDAPVLEVRKLVKSFSGVTVVKGVDLRLSRGAAVALVGENGAGKSTVIKMIAGVHQPDSGEILFQGHAVQVSSPHDAHQLGIFTVHQEPSLMPELTVAENVFMGFHPHRKIGPIRWLNRREMYDRAMSVFERLNIPIDVRRRAQDLPIAQQQMVEIAKALVHEAQVLILDEPTATLSQRETQTLFRVTRELMQQGTAVLFVSHRLHEIFELCSEVSVMRDGILVGHYKTDDLTPDRLVNLMVGREIQIQRRIYTRTGDVPKLEVKGLSKQGIFHDIHFRVFPGEIVGLAGLVGSRRTDVAEALFGIRPADVGDIRIDGRSISVKSVQDALKNGLAYVPEDRHKHGVALTMSIAWNLAVPNRAAIYKYGVARKSAEGRLADRMKSQLQIKSRSPEQPVGELSGGNQQKVVFGKWVAREPSIIVLDEPTRGVDVGAKSEIYRVIFNLAESGVAVLVISSDLPEILTLSDRILVMREGMLMGELDGADASEEAIMRLATGMVESAERLGGG